MNNPQLNNVNKTIKLLYFVCSILFIEYFVLIKSFNNVVIQSIDIESNLAL